LVYKATAPCYIKRHCLLPETSMMIKVIYLRFFLLLFLFSYRNLRLTTWYAT